MRAQFSGGGDRPVKQDRTITAPDSVGVDEQFVEITVRPFEADMRNARQPAFIFEHDDRILQILRGQGQLSGARRQERIIIAPIGFRSQAEG